MSDCVVHLWKSGVLVVMDWNGRRVLILNPPIWDRTDAESHVHRSCLIKKDGGRSQGKIQGGDIVVKGVRW